MTLGTSRFFTALAALAAATTAAGCSCGGDDYYCDDTGCYFCDGLGCREADPPVRTQCDGDFECADGQVCTEDGCTARCSLDDDCPSGAICTEGGYCLPPGSEDPVLRPGTCATSSECGDGGLCENGMCIDDPSLPDDGGGDVDEPDPGDEEPTDPTDPTDPGEDTEQPTDPGEDPGGDPSDPGDGETPGPGEEVPTVPTPEPQCRVQGDCQAGWDCINAMCMLACTTDAQCGPGCECNGDGWCAGPNY